MFRAVESDSLLLWDTDLRRLQLFSIDGLINRTVPLKSWPRGAGGRPPIGTVEGWLLIRKQQLLEIGFDRTMGAKTDTLEYLWLDPATGDTAPVASHFSQVGFVSPSGLDLIPFTIRPSAAVAADGALITEGTVPEVRKYGLDGRLLQVFRIDEPNRRVTEEDLRAYLESQVAPEYYDEVMVNYETMPIPEYRPWFEDLQVDELGRLWAEVYGWDRSRPREWVVFDKDGRARGTVLMPVGLDVQWIGRDRILGVWLDKLGVEHVQGYALKRGPRALEDSEGTKGS